VDIFATISRDSPSVTTVELVLSVLEPARRARAKHVRVKATSGHTAQDLQDALTTQLGAPSGPLSCDGIPVDPGHPIGLPPLQHGACLSIDAPPRTPAARNPLRLSVIAGPDAGHTITLDATGTTIGRSPHAGLAVDDPQLSREHLRVRLAANGIEVTDLGSTNGVHCQGIRAGDTTTLTEGLRIRAGLSVLAPLAPLPTPCPRDPRGNGTIEVFPPPRLLAAPAPVTIHAPRKPEAPQPPRAPWIAAAVPLPFAGLLALLLGPQMLLFALLSPLMLLGTWLNDRIGSRRQHAGHIRAYNAALAAALDHLDETLQREAAERHTCFPGPAEVLRTATEAGPGLWARRPGDTDFATVRVGLGEAPAHATWTHSDGSEHPHLLDVPVTVNVRQSGGLGVSGPRERTDATLRALVGQLLTQTSPRFLRIWPVGDSEPLLALLPHRAAPDLLGARPTAEAVLTELSRILAAAQSRQIPITQEDRGSGPIEVVLAPRMEELPTATRTRLLELGESGARHNVLVLAGALSREALPSSCAALLEARPDGSGLLLEADGRKTTVAPDGTGQWWAERVCRALAPLRDATQEDQAGLPVEVSLLELLDRGGENAPLEGESETHIADWDARRGPVATLGWADGKPWQVDLRRDGPHALIGGTTGAGKSELLQALVLSLATTSSPQDLVFVLVDYKGGSSFGALADLPHTVGVVTDLDPRLADRALTSLTAELKRRERVLAAAGAKDIDEYQRNHGPTGELPRLVIAIDEFRILADELPEFLDGLVHIAAVGRSLGVHLVLATQRPSGIVSADIAANVNLRVALRVRDRADSQDLIEAPDAAALPATLPGRGFARVGGGPLVPFQGARVSGAHLGTSDTEPLEVTPWDVPRLLPAASPAESSDLARLVTGLRALAAQCGLPPPASPWQQPLPSRIEAPTDPVEGRAPIGLEDHPIRQCTLPLTWHPADGVVLVAGAGRSGRTTAATTVATAAARQWSPDALHIHVIGGADLDTLAALPHVGSVVHGDDSYLVGRLVDRLTEELGRPSQDRPPHLLLIIDGWERLASPDPLEVDPVSERLIRLLRDGQRQGLSAVVTGDRSTLLSPLPSLASATFLLPLSDPVDAGLVGLRPSELPQSAPAGRALRTQDRIEIQFAAPAQGTTLADVCRQLASTTPVAEGDARALRLRPLPRRCALPELPPATGTPGHALRLGIGGDEGEVVGLDRSRIRHLLVAGPPRSGRTNALATLTRELLRAGVSAAVLDLADGALCELVPSSVPCLGRDHLDELVRLRREHPQLALVVDGLDRAASSDLDAALSELIALVARDGGFVAGSADLATLSTAYRGPAVELARHGCGLLLAPRSPHDGEVLGVRTPRGLGTDPGRGILAVHGQVTPLQVALPT
jgi:S-DNA-T family DNA segregation ATPase FtsK/SpoIIIE